NGIENLTTRGLQDLGSALFVAGQHDAAEGYFREALVLAQRYNSRRLEARSQFGLASLYIKEGRSGEGRTSAEQALAFYEPAGFRSEAASLHLLIGRVKRDQGDYAGALREFEQTSSVAEQIPDKVQGAVVHESIGSVLWRQERYPEALVQYQHAYETNRAMAKETAAGYNALQCGLMLCRVGRKCCTEERGVGTRRAALQ